MSNGLKDFHAKSPRKSEAAKKKYRKLLCENLCDLCVSFKSRLVQETFNAEDARVSQKRAEEILEQLVYLSGTTSHCLLIISDLFGFAARLLFLASYPLVEQLTRNLLTFS